MTSELWNSGEKLEPLSEVFKDEEQGL